MNNLWKGIAILGVWLGVGLVGLAGSSDNGGIAALMGFGATFVIAIVP